MTPHRPIAALAIIALLAGVARAEDPKPDNWKDQLVVGKKPNKDIGFGDWVGDKQVSFKFEGIYPQKVREDRDGWLRLFDGHKEGWAKKDVFILSRDATAFFTDRINAKASDLFAWQGRGIAWLDRQEYENAIKDFTECIRLDPKDANSFNGRGNAWSEKKEYDKAIKDFDEGIRLDPKNAIAFYNRGNAWRDKNEYDKAIKDYDEAIRLDPKNAITFHNRGFAWSDKRDYDNAINDYDEAIRLDPKFFLPFCNRGVAWHNKKEYDKAIKDYDEAIRLDPKCTFAFNNRGNAWSAKKEYDKAIKDYDEAIRLDPKYAHAFNGRGNAWLDKKEYDKAIKDYDEAIRLDPKNPYTHFSRSVAQTLNRQSKAAEGFQAVIDLQGWKGKYAVYVVILGYLAARQNGDEAAAKRFLSDSKGKLDEAWPYPVVQFLRGDLDEAALLKLATDNDKRTEARCYLGLDHALKGHKDEAMAHFRWVKEHGTKSFIEYTIAVAELERLEKAMK